MSTKLTSLEKQLPVILLVSLRNRVWIARIDNYENVCGTGRGSLGVSKNNLN